MDVREVFKIHNSKIRRVSSYGEASIQPGSADTGPAVAGVSEAVANVAIFVARTHPNGQKCRIFAPSI
jgi:hypothetical protein